MDTMGTRFVKVIFFTAGLFLLGSSHADFSLPESIQIHGFGSVGYFNTTDNNFFGDTKQSYGDIDFWELGINGSWRPLSNLQFSMQVVSRKAGETDDGDPRIDYGFADYSFISDSENLWGIRAGRVVTPLGLYGDTRDMPFTRPSILLPQSIYFDRNRQLSLSGDGGQLYGEHRSEFGDFFLQINGFMPRVDDSDFVNTIARKFPGEVDGKPSWGGRFTYEKDGGLLRLAITFGQLNVDYKPRGLVDFEAGTFEFEPLIFSLQYNAERWSLTGEYARRRSQFKDFGPLRPDTEFTGESFYVQGTYRFAPKWEAMMRYDVLYWNDDDRDGKKFEALTGLPAHSQFAKDLTFGIRWDVTPSVMLRAEYHNIDGTGWISPLENLGGTKQHWDLFALLVAVRF